MPYRHEKFITAIIIIATLSLPYFSDASLEKRGIVAGQNIGLFLSGIGSTLDQSLSAIARSAKEGIDVVVDVAERQHQMLRRILTISQNSGKHLMLGLSAGARSAKESAKDAVISTIKETTRASKVMLHASRFMFL